MKKHWKKIPVLVSMFALCLTGCNKPDFSKISGGEIDPEFATPIGYGSFGISDLLDAIDTTMVVTNQDHTIAIKYSGVIGSVTAADVLTFPQHNESFNLSTTDLGLSNSFVPSYSSSTSSSTTEKVTFPLSSGIELNDVLLNAGLMNINLSTNLQHNLTVLLSFKDTKINGNSITTSLNLNYTGSPVNNTSTQIDLKDALCDFTANGTGINQLRMDVDVTINGTGNQIAGNEYFNIDVNFNNLGFENATGYFGQQTISPNSDTLDLSIFNNPNASYHLTNPKINFSIENSFGIPMQVDINNLKCYNSNNNSTLLLSNSNLNNISIAPASAIGQTATTTVPELNSGNTTNMNQLISSSPNELIYSSGGTTNPNGKVGPLNFIDKNSKLSIKARLELPLEGYANFTLKDTFDLKLDNPSEMINSFLLRLKTNNGLPIGIKTQLTFVDSNYAKVFDLFPSDEVILDAASVDNSGNVTASKNKNTDITLNASQISKLNNVKYIIFTGTAETSDFNNNQSVIIYDYYKFDISLATKIGLKLKFKK